MAIDLLCLPRSIFFTQKSYTYSFQRSIHRNPVTWQVRCSAPTRTENADSLTAARRSANYQPSTWNYDFLQSLKNDHAVGIYEDRAKTLEVEIRRMLNNENADLLTVLELIDDIQRLGLGYRFQNDVRGVLNRYVALGAFNAETKLSIHATALSFRLLRENGFEVSQDVFNKFQGEDGKFMDSIREDVKGMLSLYEASYLAYEGENILDEARSFAISHLKDLKESTISEDIAQQVSHALELPLHHRLQRVEAQWTINAYQKSGHANQALLELAVLDYNMVQSVFQHELRDMSRWWRAMGLANKLNFARDRLMECFFWAAGMVCEPQFGNCRKVLAKVAQFITTFDDVYDVYGTLDELELLTDAVERWDVNAINDLPDYMKLCFLALYNSINEMAYDALKEHGENVLPYLTKAWSDLLKSFLQEAKWFYNKYNPTYEEYLENAWRSSSGPVLLVHAYIASTKNITKEELETLENYHDLLRWPSVILRLFNDLVSSSAELERGETANSVLLYMNENGLSENLAREHVRNLTEETWKKMNKEKFDSLFSRPFIEVAFNLARTAHSIYQYGDGHSAPDERFRKRVLSVIIEPVSLTEKVI